MINKTINRGKALANGKWIFGQLVAYDDNYIDEPRERAFIGSADFTGGYLHFFSPTGFTEIIPDTACLYTGIISADGASIFEGDIISLPNSKSKTRYLVVNNGNGIHLLNLSFGHFVHGIIKSDFYCERPSKYKVSNHVFTKTGSDSAITAINGSLEKNASPEEWEALQELKARIESYRRRTNGQ